MWANNKFDCNQISGKILASVWRFATSKFEKVLASVWRFATSNQNLKKVGQCLALRDIKSKFEKNVGQRLKRMLASV